MLNDALPNAKYVLLVGLKTIKAARGAIALLFSNGNLSKTFLI